jgi:hypothetical protein
MPPQPRPPQPRPPQLRPPQPSPPQKRSEWVFPCNYWHRKTLKVIKNFLKIAENHPIYNLKIDGKNDNEFIKVTYNVGPGTEAVKEEFMKMLPATTGISFPI